MTPEELDRWSAESLMGWTWQPAMASERRTGQWFDKDFPVFVISRDTAYPVEEWHPSNPKTGQIWMVVDKMQEMEWTLRGLSYNPFNKKWTCLFFKFTEDGDFSAYDIAETPCIAILKAAKAAKEEK